jgi:predicted permease
MREFLQIYGLVLIFALPCGTFAFAGGPIDRHLPAVAGLPASEFGLTLVAFALLGYALYRHRTG